LLESPLQISHTVAILGVCHALGSENIGMNSHETHRYPASQVYPRSFAFDNMIGIGSESKVDFDTLTRKKTVWVYTVVDTKISSACCTTKMRFRHEYSCSHRSMVLMTRTSNRQRKGPKVDGMMKPIYKQRCDAISSASSA